MPLMTLLGQALERLALASSSVPLLGRHAESGSSERVLESALRRQIVDIVRENPGLAIGDLLARLPVGWGTVYHHLSKLERCGIVRGVTSGRRRLLYLVEHGATGPDPEQRSLIAGRTAREIATIIASGSGMSIEQVVEASSASPRVVYYHLKRLLEAGLIQSDSATRYRGLVATSRLKEMLDELRRRA